MGYAIHSAKARITHQPKETALIAAPERPTLDQRNLVPAGSAGIAALHLQPLDRPTRDSR